MRPNVIKNLSLARLRLVTAAAIGILFVFLLVGFYHHDTLERMPTWSRPPSQHTQLDVDWSKFSYVKYVTNSDYLYNSVMLFEILHRLGSRPDRLMMYPSDMLPPNASATDSDNARLLLKARDEYNVCLMPIHVQHKSGADPTWADSFTKLLAFNQSEYSRVLSLDSDATMLQLMDELFLLPPCTIAMPRAYWLHPEKDILSSMIMLVQPSAPEFERIMAEVNAAGNDEYDMEILNKLYKDHAMILPHRPYSILTAEFGYDDHQKYMGSGRATWDPVAVYTETKFLHFSDWPVPKPWIKMPDSIREERQPKCHERDGIESCAERDLWNGFYADFTQRRQRVCNLNPVIET